MATTRISALTELTTPASADVLVINDDSAGSTKKIQLSNLIPDDAIDSEHYVAGSIDNEHLADDAVDSDELASGAVDIDHLSATGTPGTNYLRGDNTWATPTDTNTMGSGFTVSATTDSNATTITQGDDLMFTAGTGITTETTADGTVTIASTVTDTNTMGSGFTVSATTDSNATTITQGDDLMFTAGTGITCETTADGTVTITNTVSGASTATSSATGLIKIEDDTDQSVAAEAVSTTANRTYGLQLNSSDQGVVNVPWTDTNTTYSASDFKLDDLGAPDDNTDLDFTTSVHGLVPKCTDTGNFLKGDGTWAAGGIASLLADTTPQLGGDLDCNGNQIQWSQGADVASATALAVLTDGNYFDVTGTTTITSINTTGGVGTLIKLHFDGALTLTHDATDLILPGGANITTAAGDEAEFIEYATGDYRCTNYSKASGEGVIAGGIDCDADSWQRTSASTDQDSSAVVDFATSVHLGSNVTESGGVITVGTAGWYLVHFKFANFSASTQNANLYLRKNSSRVLGSVYWETNSEIPYLGSEATVIIECAANDTLDIYGNGYWYGEANNESHTWFTGVRLGA